MSVAVPLSASPSLFVLRFAISNRSHMKIQARELYSFNVVYMHANGFLMLPACF